MESLPYAKGALFERTQPTVILTDADAVEVAAPKSTTSFAMSHSCSSGGLVTETRGLNLEQDTKTMVPSQAQDQKQPLSPHEESLYPLDSRCVSYILIKVKSLEPYEDSYCQSQKGYCFCNPLGCGLESDTNVQDKRPYVALAMIFDRNKYEGPIVHKMNNTFIPKKQSEIKMFPEPVPQDHAFAKVLVNPQYVFKDLTDSLNNLLNANTTESEYLTDACNNFAKAVQQPFCLGGIFEQTELN